MLKNEIRSLGAVVHEAIIRGKLVVIFKLTLKINLEVIQLILLVGYQASAILPLFFVTCRNRLGSTNSMTIFISVDQTTYIGFNEFTLQVLLIKPLLNELHALRFLLTTCGIGVMLLERYMVTNVDYIFFFDDRSLTIYHWGDISCSCSDDRFVQQFRITARSFYICLLLKYCVPDLAHIKSFFDLLLCSFEFF